MSKVIAVLCSDIHLCHNCPPARSAEPDWYEAMGRMLDQVNDVAAEHGAPILCAGDVFDKWNSPAELINFALDRLPEMYAVPGQHDLPNHSLADIKRSAFWTLVEAGTIKPLNFGHPSRVYEVMVHAFPWGMPIVEPVAVPEWIKVSLAHRYVWTRGKGYPGAEKEAMVGNVSNLDGYDVAVFGDNHQSFHCRKSPTSNCIVVNPGCLIRRRQDECGYKPTIYLLHDDRTVRPLQLDVSEDCWVDEDVKESEIELDGMTDFLEELRSLDADSLDFESAVRRYCEDNKVSGLTQQMILDSMIGG